MKIVGFSNSVDGSSLGIFLCAEEFKTDLPPQGFLHQGGEDPFGERDVTHLKMTLSSVQTLHPDQLDLITPPGQYASHTLRVKQGTGSYIRAVTSAPGYALNDSTVVADNSRYKLTTQIISSSTGNTCYVFSQSLTEYKDGGVDLYWVAYTYTLISSLIWEEQHIFRDWVDKDGHTISHYERQYNRSIIPTLSGEIMQTDPNELLGSLSADLALRVLGVTGDFVPPPTREFWSDLSFDSVRNMRTLKGSTSMLAKETTEVFSDLPSLLSVVTSPTNPKSWANAYLSGKWGTKQTMDDLKAGMESVIKGYSRSLSTSKFSYLTSYSTRGDAVDTPYGRISRQFHCKVRYTPYPGWATGAIRTMQEYGVWPTLSQLADFVPFSFVMNWFSNYGDILQKADDLVYLQSQQIVGCLYSQKNLASVDIGVFSPSLAGSAKVNLSYYRRFSTSSLLVTSDSRFNLEAPSAINILDGGALLLQRLF